MTTLKKKKKHGDLRCVVMQQQIADGHTQTDVGKMDCRGHEGRMRNSSSEATVVAQKINKREQWKRRQWVDLKEVQEVTRFVDDFDIGGLQNIPLKHLSNQMYEN